MLKESGKRVSALQTIGIFLIGLRSAGWDAAD